MSVRALLEGNVLRAEQAIREPFNLLSSGSEAECAAVQELRSRVVLDSDDGNGSSCWRGAASLELSEDVPQADRSILEDNNQDPTTATAAAEGDPVENDALSEVALKGAAASGDSFSVSNKGCRLRFEPAFGEIEPGHTSGITVGFHGRNYA